MFGSLTDTRITSATVDNASWAYWVECELFGQGPQAGIYGASVTYTITAANG
jgi:hypothetical protein